MKNKRASHYFHGPEKYNCAQAVTKAFQEESCIPDSIIAAYADKGAGRAEGGICGSLFAARKLLNSPADVAVLDAQFAKEAGSIFCKEIRTLKKVSCSQTVDIAADNARKRIANQKKDEKYP